MTEIDNYCMSTFKFNDKPCSIKIDLDKYPLGYGLLYLEIIYKGESLKFTPDEIFIILGKLKESQVSNEN
jgi:hypothetical protein